MGFEPFPAESPFSHIAVIVGPLCLSRTRTSYPPKLFPSQQPFCVTTSISFSSLPRDPVSSIPMRDLKAFLRCEVRCCSQIFLPTTDPMLPWALFPFKVLPSYSNALLKNSGVHPPRRTFSGHIRFRKCDLDLLPPKWTLSTNVHAHPSGCAADAAARDTIGVETRSHAGLPTKCQPALEFFERPLLRFLMLTCQLRRSPAFQLRALQRSFRYEVALISRVFSVQDRSPLTGCQAAICRI